MYTGAVFFAARVALDPKRARVWLPPGVSLAKPCVATVFAAHFPETSFGSVYDEAGVFFHVTRRFRSAVFCPWMVVTDDVALTVGRELLGYPKKLARIAFDFGSGRAGTEVLRRSSGADASSSGCAVASAKRSTTRHRCSASARSTCEARSGRSPSGS